ncbi:hypothetical protein DLAC_07926 [Tieghemostelium lacteum]|uniref:CFA20 domain-containing protein n=1 Tax=Tieghemostelium lacteum TaxID=361077 RepID=A0A151ZAQ5_TIELA|nr:hypothetical protein DLAC_07926 [Tieghemostelium lacteum]|eukprot:KYQ91027.1 hypothetical protein DLAC_07926 [Tieghemostelium lacteum]
MLKNTFQIGILSLFYSLNNDSLELFRTNGNTDKGNWIEMTIDQDIHSKVLELRSENISNCYITSPSDPLKALSIKLPILLVILKNMDKYFSFEIQVLDDRNQKRRIRISNFQDQVVKTEMISTIPMVLDRGWNTIQHNLQDLVHQLYGSNFVEVERITFHANTRLRRIAFTEKIYTLHDMPNEFKLNLPIDSHYK